MKLISSSARLTEAVQRAELHWHTRAAPAPAGPPFTVAISREAGAGGATIARALGARLGWPVYDRELVQKVAEEMGLRTELLTSVDEKLKGWLSECLEGFNSRRSVSGSAYACRLVETLMSLAAHGACVVVGRGAVQILPAATTLRVRIVATPEDRREATRRRLGCSPQEAARWVEETDRERTAFVKQYFHKGADDLRDYDLVLSSSRFSVEDCAGLIAEALHCLEARAAARRPAPATS